MANDAVGILLALLVLIGMFRLFGPQPRFRLRLERRRPSKRPNRRVQVDPLVLKERRLAAELRWVRAQLRNHSP
ncbi:MAG: hypothetical protein K6T31_07425, partial [Alicyclobacillus sp.]|nr:hypothetical protein [Alicyclobacillus sp.]